MKYHLFTASLLAAAVLLYGAGAGGGGSLLLVGGGALELWVWVRALRGKPTPPRR